MKRQIKLTMLGVMLFAGAALYADETTSTTKPNAVKAFISKSGSFLKSVAQARSFQVGVGVVLVSAVGYYFYKKMNCSGCTENKDSNS